MNESLNILTITSFVFDIGNSFFLNKMRHPILHKTVRKLIFVEDYEEKLYMTDSISKIHPTA